MNFINKSKDRDMVNTYDAEYVSLHVRVSNRAALGLYEGKLKYEYYISKYFIKL